MCGWLTFLALPYIWNAVYLLAPETYLESSLKRIARTSSSERVYIWRIQRRGFKIQMPTENPVKIRANGGRSYSFVNRDAKYQSYDEYLELWDIHQSNLPANYRETARGASFNVPVPPNCGYSITVHWLLDGEKVSISSVGKHYSCV